MHYRKGFNVLSQFTVTHLSFPLDTWGPEPAVVFGSVTHS